MKGVVVKYNQSRGFGFIRTPNSEKDIFVHIKSVKNANRLEAGQAVNFKTEETEKGLAAVDVTVGGASKTPMIIYSVVALAIIAACLFFLDELKSSKVLIYLAAINFITFIVYGYDKFIAGSDKTRVPEKRLHQLALIGGSPAALVAQKFFRHKTIKKRFQIIYWLIVIVQLVVLWFVFF